TTCIITPVNQVLRPVGIQVELPEMRPQTIALSPDNRFLITAGKTHSLVVVNPESGDILQKVPLPSEKATNTEPASVSTHILSPDKEGQVSFTGLIFSRDGKRIYLSNVNGSIKVFSVEDGTVQPSLTFHLPHTGLSQRKAEIPAGLLLSADQKILYAVGNLSNTLFELDAETGSVRRSFDVGVASYDIVIVGQKAYVSNWGGRRPDTAS